LSLVVISFGVQPRSMCVIAEWEIQPMWGAVLGKRSKRVGRHWLRHMSTDGEKW